MKYWDDFAHANIEKTKEVLDMLLEREEKHTGVCWGITLKGDPSLIGTIAYNRFKKDGLGTIGYILHEDFWGQGIMTEVLEEFIRYGLEDLELHRIEAHVEPENIASESVLQKIGFTREGLLREREFYRNKHQDLIVYGLLKSDRPSSISTSD